MFFNDAREENGNGGGYRREDNDVGGKTWLYSRQAGSVFGETATIEAYVFDAQGLLVAQKTEVRKHVGK